MRRRRVERDRDVPQVPPREERPSLRRRGRGARRRERASRGDAHRGPDRRVARVEELRALRRRRADPGGALDQRRPRLPRRRARALLPQGLGARDVPPRDGRRGARGRRPRLAHRGDRAGARDLAPLRQARGDRDRGRERSRATHHHRALPLRARRQGPRDAPREAHVSAPRDRIAEAFARRAAEKRKALVTYLCCGDPNEEESIELAVACASEGADILELGTPFSDPTADGPAIARASQRALAKGGGLASTLRVAKAVRARTSAPIVLFGYYNPLFVRGEERVVAEAADAGIDAFLVVDLPADESTSLRTAAAARGIGVVPLVAPTTRPERVTQLAELATRFPTPFVYYVSMTGVTGGAGGAQMLSEAGAAAARVRETTKRPTVVGFGIDSAAGARAAAAEADGVVVGSAIVRRTEEGVSPEARLAAVRALVADLRGAV
ncbi:MAG: tryptophan synthase subunit alpha [Deltaproteobacteria bacterium]|nr:tryptophan synthase subunit alpha [Deltaproteobacteria bacterium]